MYRNFDESRVSGTGYVLEGFIFENGKTVVSWKGVHSSIGIYDTYSEFEFIHILSHPSNKTRVEFRSGEVKQY